MFISSFLFGRFNGSNATLKFMKEHGRFGKGHDFLVLHTVGIFHIKYLHALMPFYFESRNDMGFIYSGG